MQESPLFTKTYDFTKWLLEHTIKFPKSQRFVMAKRLEEAILKRVAGERPARRLLVQRNRQRAGGASVQSWLGHARHADSLGLRRQVFRLLRQRLEAPIAERNPRRFAPPSPSER